MSEPLHDGVDEIARQWQEQGVDADLQPLMVLGRVIRLMKHIETELAECHGHFGLKVGEFDVLATLRRAGQPFSLTPSQLYQAMLLSSGAMTNRLDRLEKKGLIERKHSQEDRRSVHVCLTSQGKSLIDEMLPSHLQAQNRLLRNLAPAEREQLVGLLKTWLAAFEGSK
ncbi:MarR family transcriptional regulator [Aliiglaciecola sp. CAU 1673]|uniref:MarR family winged helix-turn-helix transcriptional regulator n=1 Tax=Aliiglaciecola sp. CAU 1673 TaxID=3032595 RepID=UPI0023DA84F9|nr:MarR family transcriptional regulator [Aliiglaciecola sp. CAU 1673]MDF2178129.1 MarR family transcriptional regulator [Aliiglaciecola sp. CAU 1673]